MPYQRKRVFIDFDVGDQVIDPFFFSLFLYFYFIITAENNCTTLYILCYYELNYIYIYIYITRMRTNQSIGFIFKNSHLLIPKYIFVAYLFLAAYIKWCKNLPIWEIKLCWSVNLIVFIASVFCKTSIPIYFIYFFKMYSVIYIISDTSSNPTRFPN